MEPVIKVEGMSKAYHGKNAIRDLSISVNRGEIFGLLGNNGAGKSTSVECILGTRTADKGTASILGMNPRTQRRTLFERVGVQFQEGNYQDRITVEELCQETVSLYREAEDYLQLLKQFELSEKTKNMVSELSGGQRQRLFLVLALIPKPEVVFLDELTTGLDTKARRQVWKYLESLKKAGLTVLLTSHFMDEVEVLCDRIGILKQGTMIFCGTVADAIEQSPYGSLEEAYLWYADECADDEKLCELQEGGAV